MTTLTAVCEGCRFPADPTLSVVWIELGLVAHATHTPHLDVHPFEDTTLAHWRIHHVHCLPARGHVYDIDMDQLTTTTGLAEWTRHLSVKNWLPHTDWYALVATAQTGQLTTAAESEVVA